MNKLKLLKKARKLIKDFDNWTDGPEAVDRDGRECNPRSNKAIAWCAIGALDAITKDADLIISTHALLDRVANELYGKTPGFRKSIISVNEGSGAGGPSSRKRHKRVLKVYKEAIKQVS